MSGELLKRGRERGRCAAGLFADAAGAPGVRRIDGFASWMGKARPREALAKARHPWAILCNPFGVGVRRRGMVKDCASRSSWLNTGKMMREGVRIERNHGFTQSQSLMEHDFSTRDDVNTLALCGVVLRRCGHTELKRLAECCGLGGPRALSAGCFTDENAMT